MEFWDQKIVAGVKSGINGWFRRTYTFLPPNIRPQLMHVFVETHCRTEVGDTSYPFWGDDVSNVYFK